jgi:protein-tyrosine phosphatase
MIDYGITTVIDLRTEAEVKGAPGPPFSIFQSTSPVRSPTDEVDGTLVRLHLPLIDDATTPALNETPAMQDRYILMLDRRQAAMGAIFEAISSADGPVLFHCFAGKDRTGLVAALMLSMAGVDPKAIGDDYAETDVQLAAKYEQWLATAAPDRLEAMRDELRCPPEWMLNTLDHLERKWGGVESYLEAAGLDAAAITRLQGRLTS